ncbi:MAG: mannose-1-phosphate guanylyltransferase [Planctomycetia bacterium]|nr:mannose-1-phosphate guanylyltransferase [Planctomycetia bacterium]
MSQEESGKSLIMPVAIPQNESTYAVVIAGGNGVRLWPESRARRPKQFLLQDRRQSMLFETVERLSHMIPNERILIATSESFRQLVREALPGFPDENIIGEPVSRNTAPAIGLAAEILAQRDPNATLVILPSDHFIEPVDLFCSTLQTGVALADEDPARLVILGIPPTAPSVSYGYIECGAPLLSPALANSAFEIEAFRVKSFREKPLQQEATEYIKADWFLWNAGIFILSARRVLQLLEQLEPGMAARLHLIGATWGTPAWSHQLADGYPQVRNISFDYAVMEHADSIVVLKSAFVWDDLGSFKSLARHEESHVQDEQSNTVSGPNVVCIDSHHNVIRQVPDENGTPSSRLIGLVGVDDLIVVQTDDVTLICQRSQEADIRRLVEQIRDQGKSHFL